MILELILDVVLMMKHWYGNMPDLPLLRYMCQVVIRKTQFKELGFIWVHGLGLSVKSSLWTQMVYDIHPLHTQQKNAMK